MNCKNRFFTYLTGFFFLVSFYDQVKAQYSNTCLKHYSVADGLPGTEVYEIIQARNGYLWFATDMGAVRYDGNEFRTFGFKDGLPDNSVLSVYEDHKGRIWFIPYSCRLSYFENDTVKMFPFNDAFLKNKNLTLKSDFSVDLNDNVYMAMYGEGFFKISKEGHVEQVKESGDKHKFTIIETKKGEVFSALLAAPSLEKRNCIIHYKSRSFQRSFESVKPGMINPLYRSFYTNGEIVSFINNHIVRAGISKTEIFDFADRILCIFPHPGDQLWIGTARKGVALYQMKNGRLIPGEKFLNGLSVTSVCVDFEGGYWFSTLEDGVYYLPSLNFKIVNPSVVSPNLKITKLTRFGNSIYANCNACEVYRINPDAPDDVTKINLPVDDSSYIRNCFYDKVDDRLFFQSYSTVTTFDKEEKQKPFARYVCSGDFLRDVKSGDLMAGTMGGIYNFSLPAPRKINYNKEQFRATALAQFSDGQYLVGGVSGLYTLNKDSLLEPYRWHFKFLQTRITAITRYAADAFVIGTRGSGVVFLTLDTAFVITTENGLVNDIVNQVYVNDTTAWVSTNSGLSAIVFGRDKPVSYSVRNFTLKDGLLFAETNCAIKSGDNLIFGTNKGLFYFKPDSFQMQAVAPKLLLRSIRVNGNRVNKYGILNFGPDENNITILLTGISYRSQGNLIYRYRFEGQDTAWRQIRNRQIDLAGLGAGKYLLHVIAINAAGLVSDEIVSVKFVIRERYYQTLWFKLLIFSLAALCIYIFFRRRISAINKKNEEKRLIQKTIAGLEMKALRAQMNPHFTFNVLNSISYFITHNDNESAQKYLTRFSRLIRMILENSKSDFNSLENEVKLLGIYLELESLRFEEKFSFTIDVEHGINQAKNKVPSMFIQPFIENAIKHGLEKKKGPGKVDVSFKKSGNALICTITDNGIGRKKSSEVKLPGDESHLSISTDIANDRVKSLNRNHQYLLSIETIDMEDMAGEATGTQVIITIPQQEND